MGNVFNAIEATHPNLCFFSSFVKRGYGAQAVLYLSRRKRFKPSFHISPCRKIPAYGSLKKRGDALILLVFVVVFSPCLCGLFIIWCAGEQEFVRLFQVQHPAIHQTMADREADALLVSSNPLSGTAD